MEKLNELVDKFNKRVNVDKKLRDEIFDLDRKIVLNFKDDGKYYLHLENGSLNFIEPIDDPDIVVEMSVETFNKILSKEIDALSAYITRKIVVKASLSDKLLLSELLKN
ncbi:MAG: SCP2 sterol-binding domain-containing protein [Thermoplasmata archaeon]